MTFFKLIVFNIFSLTGQFDVTKFDENQKDPKELRDRDGKYVRANSTAKTFGSALQELKSSDAAIDFKSRNHGLSKLQLRRKATKMEDISSTYETKTGIKITLSETGNLARSALSKTLSGDGVEYRASSSIRAKSGHQKAIKSNKVFIVASAQDTGISNLLSLNSSSDGSGYKAILTTTDKETLANDGNSSSADYLDQSSFAQVLSQNMIHDPQDMTHDPRYPYPQEQQGLTQPLSTSLAPHIEYNGKGKGGLNNTGGSVISAVAGPNGSRSKLIADACSKFTSFNQMESLLTAPMSSKTVLPLHPLDLEKLNKARENKKMLLEKASGRLE